MKNYIDYGYDYKITKKTDETGAETYFTEFVDGEGKKQIVQIDKAVADVLTDTQKEEARTKRDNDRHCTSLDDYADRLACRDIHPSLNDSAGMTRVQKVRKVLSLMKPNQAEILEKVFFENKTQQALANDYGISQPSVHERIERAKANFKKLFLKNFGEKPL